MRPAIADVLALKIGLFLDIFQREEDRSIGRLWTSQMYAPRACSQCCGIASEDHGCGLLDYVHAYMQPTKFEGEGKTAMKGMKIPYVEKTLQDVMMCG